jgi:hypothetical protein
MTENNEGLHFAWYTGGTRKGSFYISSGDNGKTFTGYDSISSRGMHPQIIAMPDDKLVVAWDEPIKKGDVTYKRIGLQVRTEHGIREINGVITPDDGYSTYPVIKAVNDNELIVAYSSKREYGEYVKWQRVKLGI